MHEVATRRRKLHAWMVIGASVALCLGWFIFQLFGPNPRIIVSRETTFITDPLGPDGLPDYAAYYYQRDSEGVTFENNAAVLTWQALWPGELRQKHWLPVCDALGMKEIPSSAEALVSAYDKSLREQIAREWASRFVGQDWQDIMADGLVDEVIDQAMSRPWTGEVFFLLAQWAKQNRLPLEILIDASKRPRYFSPSPSLLDGSDDNFFEMLLPGVQGMRAAGRGLTLRAMGRVGEGHIEDAWQDLLACHRLARLTAQGDFLVAQLVGAAMDHMACRADSALLGHKELTPGLVRQILADLNQLPPVTDVAQSIDQNERLMAVDFVARLASGKLRHGSLQAFRFDVEVQALRAARVDWNYVLRDLNRWYDQLITAARLPTLTERKAAFERIDDELVRQSHIARSAATAIGSVFNADRRNELMSAIMASTFLPAVGSVSRAEDRANALLELTRVAAALAVYRAVEGEYPEQLADLTPEILPQLQQDLYSGQPFIYQRKADGGYLLYSVFQNGVDDGGTGIGGKIVAGEWVDEPSEDFDYNASDLVIRVPVPALKLPDAPKDDDEW